MVGIGLIVTIAMSWGVNEVSIKIAGMYGSHLSIRNLLASNILKISSPNIISSRIHRCHALPCLDQLCVGGFSFSDDTSPPPESQSQTVG